MGCFFVGRGRFCQKLREHNHSAELGHAVTYSQHNGRGQPGRIVGVNGEAVEYDYDACGRVRRVRSFRNGGIQSTQYACLGPARRGEHARRGRYAGAGARGGLRARAGLAEGSGSREVSCW